MALVRHLLDLIAQLDLFLSSTWGRADQQTSHDSNRVWGVWFCAQIDRGIGLAVELAHTVRMGPGYCATRGSMVSSVYTLHGRRCYQPAVERILVKRWQGLDGGDVIADNRQLAIAVVEQAATQ